MSWFHTAHPTTEEVCQAIGNALSISEKNSLPLHDAMLNIERHVTREQIVRALPEIERRLAGTAALDWLKSYAAQPISP
jgi:hypothetical protein